MFSFQSLNTEHWPQVSAIYMEGIATGQATFQQSPPSWDEWDRWHLPHSRIIVVNNHDIMGWAALSPVSTRPVYKGVAEVSVYIGEKFRGNGIGLKLLQQLVKESEKNGIWTLQSAVFPENAASVRIHEQNGFRIIGRRERIAQMNRIWRDTFIMERRSKVVGI